MNNAQQLAEWVASKHEGQTIRRTEEPYFNHVAAVADLAKAAEFGYEIGLCHDLLEDTVTTIAELWGILLKFGYDTREATVITSAVMELTDHYTAATYPQWSKKHRKELESARLLKISPTAQTVKYADLMYNIDWMLKYDQQHAKKYLKKKKALLTGMDKGDHELHQRALAAVDQALVNL